MGFKNFVLKSVCWIIFSKINIWQVWDVLPGGNDRHCRIWVGGWLVVWQCTVLDPSRTQHYYVFKTFSPFPELHWSWPPLTFCYYFCHQYCWLLWWDDGFPHQHPNVTSAYGVRWYSAMGYPWLEFFVIHNLVLISGKGDGDGNCPGSWW